ncbi:UDP-glucuronate 4-epimerase [Anaerolineae bacterium]|nr:UDP-glucuronate 4-epimerase [Anaerolineae bacterium]
MATLLVTGCAGFIGAKVTEFLLADGHTVIGVDNLNDAYDARLKQWRLARISQLPGFQYHHLDITDRLKLRALWESRGQTPFDAVINLAARAGVRQSIIDPYVYYETNVNGTLNLLELCKTFGVKKLVLASTSSLYGNVNPLPYREDADTNHPLSSYAASKKAAEVLCYSYHYLHHLGITVLRYFTVYGPAGRPDMAPLRFVQWISEGRPLVVYGDGTQQRDFTYVDDIARATIAALPLPGYEVINVGSNQPIPLMELIHCIENLVKRQAQIVSRPPHSADALATWADITKAEKLLGWHPQFTYPQGLANLVAWYQENREWAKEIKTE